MNVKDKVVFGILIVLLIAGGYFHYQSNELNRRMDGIIKEEQAHTFITQNEFREDLRQ